jgi:hypothetical protein
MLSCGLHGHQFRLIMTRHVVLLIRHMTNHDSSSWKEMSRCTPWAERP